MPRTSVVVPAFNCRDFIGQALQSVFDQTCPVHEVIVVNDGSRDDLEQTLVPFRDRITYVEQERRGAAAARNEGIARATGDWIAFLDADDIWLPDKTERQCDLLSRYPDVCLLYGQVRDFSPTEELAVWPDMVSETPSDTTMRRHWAALWHMPPTPTVMVRRSTLERTGLFDTRLATAEDLDLWVRLLAVQPFVGLPRVLARRRVHANSLTRTHPAPEQYRTYLRVLQRRREDIRRWAPRGFRGGRAFIHTAMANAYSHRGLRRKCGWHSALGLLRAHPNRALASKLLVESLVGPTLYRVVTGTLRNLGWL